jgi:hypothetical protein
MAGTSGPTGTSTGTAAPTGTGATSWADSMASSNIYSNMQTVTNTNFLTQTSQPDITSLVNGVMQQMVGRNATPEEIQRYGAELLAAERANPGSYSGVTQYGPSGKRSDVTGTQLTTGVDPSGFLQTLISGTADAQSYKAATGYMQAMMQSIGQFKGEYNG